MSLVAMAVYDTEENQRTTYTKKAVESLLETVDWTKHKLFVSDNGSCEETILYYNWLRNWFPVKENLTISLNGENLGTANAVNLGWKTRDGHAVKMDNDVVIHKVGWLDDLIEVVETDPKIGQVGLKRKDCWESPDNTNPFYKSELKMLSHKLGEKWTVVEVVNHVMGTCVLHSSKLLDKVGYLYQPSVYGFDDSLMSFRSTVAGFYNCFLPSIEIDHIDTGETSYQKWKEAHASTVWKQYHEKIEEYRSGKIYYNPFQ